MAVVGVSDGVSLADDIETHEPQVVLLSIDAGDSAATKMARISLAPDAAARMPALVMLIESPNAPIISDALRSGVRGVLPSDATADEIIAAIEAAAVGLVAIPAELATKLTSATRTSTVRAPTTSTQPLTPREVEILGMLAEGLANKNIAARLGISEHTVKTHVASILTKLDAYSRAEAVAIGARRGLILL